MPSGHELGDTLNYSIIWAGTFRLWCCRVREVSKLSDLGENSLEAQVQLSCLQIQPQGRLRNSVGREPLLGEIGFPLISSDLQKFVPLTGLMCTGDSFHPSGGSGEKADQVKVLSTQA